MDPYRGKKVGVNPHLDKYLIFSKPSSFLKGFHEAPYPHSRDSMPCSLVVDFGGVDDRLDIYSEDDFREAF